MIPLTPDEPTLPRWIAAMPEHCCFCGRLTRTWYRPRDVAVCTECAETRDPSEVPDKETWCTSPQGRGEITEERNDHMGSFGFQGGWDGDRQQDEFQNATQTTLGEDERSVAIAVTPRLPADVDPLDEDAVRTFLERTMRPLVAAGFDVEVRYGDFERG